MPGETVVISGSGFSPGETVSLLLIEDPEVHGPREWEVEADAEGGFTDESFSPEVHHIGVTFTLTATGQESGLTAQTSFTDGNIGLTTNLPSPMTIDIAWRRFAATNTTCSGTATTSGTALGVNTTSNTVGPATGVNESVEFTAPAVTGYAFSSWTVMPAGTVVSNDAVECFEGIAANIRYQANYVPGPTKLAFITGPFTDIVGECMGPMQVQSQNSASAELAVTANTTVNLSTSGTGGFYLSAGCPTNGLVSVQIIAGQFNSSQFWYKPEAVGTGTHTLTAAAAGLTSATQDQTVNKAPSDITYTGAQIVLSGNTLVLSALVTSDFDGCVAGRTVRFRIEPHPLYNPWEPGDPDQLGPVGLTTTTNSSGVATLNLSTTGWVEGAYEIRANVAESDDCLAANDPASLTVMSPGGAATGGGFIAGSTVGGARVNFGFTVRRIEGSDPPAYKGQFVVIKKDNGVPVWRCKGALTNYGVAGDLNAASGTCDFQLWDPGAPDGGDWYVPAYGANSSATITFRDFGTGKGKNAPPPDEFGFQTNYSGAPVGNPSFAITPIKGGNIDVKDSGSTTTSTGGTEEPTSPTKGGGKKK